MQSKALKHSKGLKATLAGIAASSIGTIIGLIMMLVTNLNWLIIPVAAFAACVTAIALTLRPPNRKIFPALLAGLSVGVIGMVWLALDTPLTAGEIWVIGVGLIGFATIVSYQVMHAERPGAPDSDQVEVPVMICHTSDWKKRRFQAKLKTGRRKQSLNEQVVQVLSDLHPMRLVVSVAPPLIILPITLWGIADFEGFSAIGDFIPEQGRALMLVLAIVSAAGFWLYINRKRFLKLATLGLLVPSFFVWLYLGTPGWDTIDDTFAEGRPGPWLFYSLLDLAWLTWRIGKWYYGVMGVTDKRLIVCTVLPYPLPNSLRRMNLDKVATCDTAESTLGNIFRYGKLIIDGLGNMDQFFHSMRFVPHHEEFAEAVSP